VTNSLYDIPVRRIDGADATLAEHRGDVLLIVNVSSQCGLTPQYAPLQHIYEQYHDRGFAVLGFPANDFGAQEPGTNHEIKAFCETSFGVQFPMFAKIAVKGEAQHPLYRHLIAASGQHSDIAWNFEKFLVDRSGSVVARFAPDVAPDDPRIVAAVEALL